MTAVAEPVLSAADQELHERLATYTREGEALRVEIERLEQARAATPRGDRQKAGELLVEWQRAVGKRKGVMSHVRELRMLVEAEERHWLWADAVRAVAGQEALTFCYAWMKAERKKRRQARTE